MGIKRRFVGMAGNKNHSRSFFRRQAGRRRRIEARTLLHPFFDRLKPLSIFRFALLVRQQVGGRYSARAGASNRSKVVGLMCRSNFRWRLLSPPQRRS
jgi:hypothetical protein